MRNVRYRKLTMFCVFRNTLVQILSWWKHSLKKGNMIFFYSLSGFYSQQIWKRRHLFYIGLYINLLGLKVQQHTTLHMPQKLCHCVMYNIVIWSDLIIIFHEWTSNYFFYKIWILTSQIVCKICLIASKCETYLRFSAKLCYCYLNPMVFYHNKCARIVVLVWVKVF